MEGDRAPETVGGRIKLLLFDIDGTLLASGGAGERALRAAAQERFTGGDGLDGIEIAGRTDTGIAREVLRRYGAEESEENVAAFLGQYLTHLERLLPTTSGRLLPGVPQLLERLNRRDDVLLGLLTGNLARGAELKLKQYGIWQFFAFGAYADDHHDRNELGPFALKRALQHRGLEIPPDDTFVIGDTPYDVACGRAIGARTIAVATGIHAREALTKSQPDFVFDDLGDTAAVLKTFGLE